MMRIRATQLAALARPSQRSGIAALCAALLLPLCWLATSSSSSRRLLSNDPVAQPPADSAAHSAVRARTLGQRAVALLKEKCGNCHGAEKQEGELRLDTYDAVMKGGGRGAVVDVTHIDRSLLLRSVDGSDSDLEMPPRAPLSAGEVELIRQWLAARLPWPAADQPQMRPDNGAVLEVSHVGNAWNDPQNPVRIKFGGERLDGWSWQQVKRPALPVVNSSNTSNTSNTSKSVSSNSASSATDASTNREVIELSNYSAAWQRQPLDSFLAAAWLKAGYRPAADGSLHALGRRAALDLIGLPPSDEMLQSLLSDESPDGYDRYIDRLLASPRHGEHVARMWLDVVRYSDSNGFDWDEFRREAWRYRDYVVRAFNRDLPFTQFVREQLAGDLLQVDAPQNADERDRLLATGYLRMGPHDNAASLFNEQDRGRAELLADLTETTASAFLAQTFACCRCHDHKTDPFLQEDHYRLRAFFASVEFADDLPIDLADEQASIRKHNAPFDEQIAELDQRIAALKKDKADAELLEPLEKERSGLAKQRRSFTHALLMRDKAAERPATFVFYQGDHRAPRQQVSAGLPTALFSRPMPTNDKEPSSRLALADWIASNENPWTARVIVNRLWQMHFGDGLVATSNDFGLTGAAPVNPELLDWLACELIEDNWSLKRLTRRMVTSSTYRQVAIAGGRSAQAQQEMPVASMRSRLRRLSAEQTRDILLACSGLLEVRAGGPPIWPELPPEILQANPAFLDDNATKTKGWYPSPASDQFGRALYLIQKRTVRIPLLETLDLPENSVSCARRESSIVAPQALSLLNGELALAAAEALARLAATESDGDAQLAVRAVFAHTLQRPPTIQEQQLADDFLAKHTLTELCRAMLNANELMFIP